MIDMIDEKIIHAMQVVGDKPLSSSTRVTLWRIRDKALKRHAELNEFGSSVLNASWGLWELGSWWRSNLLAIVSLSMMMAIIYTFSPWKGSQDIKQTSFDTCFSCLQLDRMCQL